jgi:hypothetical protein
MQRPYQDQAQAREQQRARAQWGNREFQDRSFSGLAPVAPPWRKARPVLSCGRAC